MKRFFQNALKTCMIAGAVLAGAAATAHAQQYIGGDLELSLDDDRDVRILAADVSAEGRAGADVSILAADVTVDLMIGGDLDIAAADVTVEGSVSGDANFAAADITIAAPVGGELNAAGADVSLSSRVSGDASIAGAFVVIDEEASIGGYAEIAGREVYMDGRLEQGGEVRGREVFINGVVNGPLEIYARDLHFGETAVVAGPITVRGPSRPETAPGAQLGELTYVEEAFNESSIDGEGIDLDIDFLPGVSAAGWLYLSGAFILGVFVVVLFPRSTMRISACLRSRPFSSGGLGVVVYALYWILALTLAVLLFATVIGALLAPFVIATIPVIYLLGSVFGAFAIGDAILARFNGEESRLRLLGGLVIVTGALALAMTVPLLGWLLVLVVNLVGLGAWTLAIFQRQSGSRAPAAPAGDAV